MKTITISYSLYNSYYILIVGFGRNQIENIWVKIVSWKFTLRSAQNKKNPNARKDF